jgi:hypothetical protein
MSTREAGLDAPTYIQWHRVMRQYEHGTPYSNPEPRRRKGRSALARPYFITFGSFCEAGYSPLLL